MTEEASPARAALATSRPARARPSAQARRGSDYTAASIQVLEGLEAVREAPRHVHRLDRRTRPPSPRLGGRRQLDRRGDGRPGDDDQGHDPKPTASSSSRTTVAACRSASTRPARTRSKWSTRSSTPAASSAAAATRCRGGLHGVGVSVVNALSTWMRVESARDGSVWAQEYERGKPTGPGQEDRSAGHAARHDHELPRRPGDVRDDRVLVRPDQPAPPRVRVPHEAASGSRSSTSGPIASARSTSRVASSRSSGTSTGTRRSSTRARSTSSGAKAAPPSRSRSSTTTPTPRTSWPSPTTSTRSTAAPTSPASARP